jgi:hypothetical protein
LLYVLLFVAAAQFFVRGRDDGDTPPWVDIYTVAETSAPARGVHRGERD